jgi:predicted nucleotidyltransferase
MNATPLLTRLLKTLADQRLEVVLIGNAAAAIHGAPVTTLDFDFMFRETPGNMRKLKRAAAALGATIMRPYYPVSRLYRLVHDPSGLQADFMPVIHGVRSFEGLRERSATRDIAGCPVRIASLDDIIASKKAAGRAQDLAVLPVLEELRRAGTPAEPRKRRKTPPRKGPPS